MNEIPLKERMKIARHAMPAQKPQDRIGNFNEVNQGFTPKMALEEAQRCLQCKAAPCTDGCPVHVKIPQFILKLVEGDPLAAADTILEDNFLPAICGRVCPQENLCEANCVLAKKGKSVAIGNLERFTADSTTAQRSDREEKVEAQPTGKKVALVGSGPASLACAGDLIRFGHSVTVFEALHAFGGVLVYGIPELFGPKIDNPVDRLDNIEVVFDHDDRVAAIHEALQHTEEFLDVLLRRRLSAFPSPPDAPSASSALR